MLLVLSACSCVQCAYCRDIGGMWDSVSLYRLDACRFGSSVVVGCSAGCSLFCYLSCVHLLVVFESKVHENHCSRGFV